MMSSYLFIFLIPTIAGFLLVHIIWPHEHTVPAKALLKILLGIGAGFGIASLLFFAWLVMRGPDRGLVPCMITEISCVVILLFLILFAGKGKTVNDANDNPPLPGSTIRQDALYKSLLGITGVIFIVSLLSFILITSRSLHGWWDAWAQWNVKARFLFRGGDVWQRIFLPGYLPSPDYPLLLPGFIARSWKLIGSDTVLVPVLVAMFFTFATAGVLITSLSMVNKRIEGLLGGMVLLATPYFIKHGASQCADVPLAFFFCATLSLFMIIDHSYEKNRRLLLLCGFLAGLSAWTKNEGVPFIASLVAARLIIIWRLKGFKTCIRETTLFITGAIPAALAIGYLKARLVPPSTLCGNDLNPDFAQNLICLPRYIYISKAFIAQFLHFGGFWIGVIPLLLVYPLIRGVCVDKKNTPTLLTLFVVLTFMIMSYFSIYLITPWDLSWKVGSSISRVILQLWPSIILFIFLMVKPIKRESMN